VSEPAVRAALHVSGLKKAYKDVMAVDGIALEVWSGECFGLLGPNGAGKTTTIEICEGLTEPDAGDVEVLGLRWASDASALRQRLGIQLQETQLSDKLTVTETLSLFRSFYRQGPPPSDAIALVQLQEKRDARVGTLSGGQKQRLSIARTLLLDPRILILDDSTSSVDTQTEYLIQQALTAVRKGRTTLVIAQRLRTVKNADQILVLRDGEIIERGTHEELIAQGGQYREIYDLELRDQEEALKQSGSGVVIREVPLEGGNS
jgi:ABC-2 type transport system ATP-binding protein